MVLVVWEMPLRTICSQQNVQNVWCLLMAQKGIQGSLLLGWKNDLLSCCQYLSILHKFSLHLVQTTLKGVIAFIFYLLGAYYEFYEQHFTY